MAVAADGGAFATAAARTGSLVKVCVAILSGRGCTSEPKHVTCQTDHNLDHLDPNLPL